SWLSARRDRPAGPVFAGPGTFPGKKATNLGMVPGPGLRVGEFDFRVMGISVFRNDFDSGAGFPSRKQAPSTMVCFHRDRGLTGVSNRLRHSGGFTMSVMRIMLSLGLFGAVAGGFAHGLIEN